MNEWKALNRLTDKVEECRKILNGRELVGHGKDTARIISNVVTFIHELDKDVKNYSPVFTPFYAFNEDSQGMWAALWAGVYLEVKTWGIPLEAVHSMSLKVELFDEETSTHQSIDIPTKGQYFTSEHRYKVFAGDVSPPIEKGCIKESYYALAVKGVKEGWWTEDLVHALPKRGEDVLEYLAHTQVMTKANAILDNLEGPPVVTLTPSRENDDSPQKEEE